MTPMEGFRKECSAFFDSLSGEGHRALVFGEGLEKQPPLMLIGEAPGEQEALQLRPFVGKAGKNLDEFLTVLQLKREEIYITNVVKVRPSRLSPAGRIVNRPPNREEKELFTPWLMREIAIVRPQALVTLGNVALQALLGKGEVIGDHHGQCVRAAVCCGGREQTFEVFPLYHPASIIYNRSLADVYAEDLRKLRALLDRVI